MYTAIFTYLNHICRRGTAPVKLLYEPKDCRCRAPTVWSIYLHGKKQAYRRNGVKEYIVWQVLEKKLSWFYLEQGEYLELLADDAGVMRSRVFPGLWLAASELLAGNMQAVLTTLQVGLQSAEYAAFVKQLSA